MLTNGFISLECILDDVTINNVGKRETVYEHLLDEVLVPSVADRLRGGIGC